MNLDLFDKVAGRRVIASISGGKDSAAMSLHLRDLGIEHDRVFLDTGWEHPKTYEYLADDLPRALGPITTVRGAKQMEDLIRAKMMFPSRTRRFCTEELKVFPMQAYLKQRVADGEDLINAVGIRHAESQQRAQLAEWEWSDGFDCEVWRPLIEWTEQDVIDIHRRHGLKPNPLYLMGASRVGCWPCIYARKAEIRLIAEIDPDRIDRLRVLETEIADGARARYDRDRTKWLTEPDAEPPTNTAKHDRWEKKRDRLMRPFSPPTWFQSQAKDANGRYPMLPIDAVVAWSRTAHGGKQFEAFANREPGCMRWGLCETDKETA